LVAALIPLPAEAGLIWDMPDWNPIQPPCTSLFLRPPHAHGLNVVYAAGHAKFTPFLNRPTPSDPNGNCLENWWIDNSWKGFFAE
jgi:hypothetical protein